MNNANLVLFQAYKPVYEKVSEDPSIPYHYILQDIKEPGIGVVIQLNEDEAFIEEKDYSLANAEANGWKPITTSVENIHQVFLKLLRVSDGVCLINRCKNV